MATIEKTITNDDDIGSEDPENSRPAERALDRGSGIDMIERRDVEQALNASQVRFRDFAEMAADYFWQADSQDRLVYMSDRFEEIAGVSSREVIGKTREEVWAIGQAKLRWEGVGSVAPTHDRKSYDLEIEWCRPNDCGRRDLFIRAIPVLGPQGEFEGYRGIGRDVTAIKESEEALRAAQARQAQMLAELEQKNSELERFAYTASHDLKSPLITIRAFADLLVRDLDERDEQRAKHDAAKINEAANKMQILLNDLIEISRIGLVANRFERISLDQVVEDAISLVIDATGVSPRNIAVAPNLPEVSADKARLTVVMHNILDNAAKYSAPNREPRIEVGVLTNDPAEHVIYVRDKGRGIEPAYHRRVFELFERLDTDTHGTGLGLNIAKRIIETHGGRIWIESEGLAHGCTICFTLPRGDGSKMFAAELNAS